MIVQSIKRIIDAAEIEFSRATRRDLELSKIPSSSKLPYFRVLALYPIPGLDDLTFSRTTSPETPELSAIVLRITGRLENTISAPSIFLHF